MGRTVNEFRRAVNSVASAFIGRAKAVCQAKRRVKNTLVRTGHDEDEVVGFKARGFEAEVRDIVEER